MKTLKMYIFGYHKAWFFISKTFLDNLLPCLFLGEGGGWGEHGGFSVNPKPTIISQLLQVPMATDLASGEKTSWFG